MAIARCCFFPLKNGLIGLATAYLIILGLVLVSALLSMDEIEQYFEEVAYIHQNLDIDPEMFMKYTIAIISFATIITAVPLICFIIGVFKVSKNKVITF